MKRVWCMAALGMVLALSGCRAEPAASNPGVTGSEVRETNSVAGSPVEVLSGMSLRNLVADSAGKRFIVQDDKMALYLVDAAGQIHLGDSTGMDLVAAWGPNDYGYAYARKAGPGPSYEIVGVGHEGSRVLARTIGYPGAIRFVGQEVHFIDGQGWNSVSWDGEAVLKGDMYLGPRRNQAAWCSWNQTGPACIGGYGNDTEESQSNLTMVRAEQPALTVMEKGEHRFLNSGAFSGDGRLFVTSLQVRRGNVFEARGKVTAAWFDEAGKLVKSKEFPVLAREVAFDAYGRLIAHVYPPDGAEPGSIAFVDLHDGSVSPIAPQGIEGPFRFVMAPDYMKLYVLTGKGVQEIGLDKPLTNQ